MKSVACGPARVWISRTWDPACSAGICRWRCGRFAAFLTAGCSRLRRSPSAKRRSADRAGPHASAPARVVSSMRQPHCACPLEVKPESCSRLTALLEELRVREETGPRAVPQKYAALAREIPPLHFMSMSVFTSAAYDPIFVTGGQLRRFPQCVLGAVRSSVWRAASGRPPLL